MSHFGLAFLGLELGGFRARAELLLETRGFRTLSLETRRFSGGLFAGLGCSLRGGDRGGLLFGGGLDVRGFSPTTNGRFGSRGSGGHWFRRGSGRAAATSGRRRRRLLLGARALLSFPSRARSSHLIVREQAHMAAKWNVQLTK